MLDGHNSDDAGDWTTDVGYGCWAPVFSGPPPHILTRYVCDVGMICVSNTG